MICPSVERVISGGQTGADRGGLDAALFLGIPIGGWCPRGRRAEDGAVPAAYPLVETEGVDYRERTRFNVRDADATLVFVRPDRGVTPGTLLTIATAVALKKAHLVVEVGPCRQAEIAAALLVTTRLQEDYRVLNVAGSRESRAPGLQGAVVRVLFRALGGDIRPNGYGVCPKCDGRNLSCPHCGGTGSFYLGEAP